MDSLGSTQYGLHELNEKLSQELASDAQTQEQTSPLESMAQRVGPILERCLHVINNQIVTQTYEDKQFTVEVSILQQMLTHYKESHPSSELDPSIKEVISACKELSSPTSNFYSLPHDVLREVFKKHDSFDDMLKWGQICRKFRAIAQEINNWGASRAFQDVAQLSMAHDKQQQFLSFLAKLSKKPETAGFSRQLATLFFNRASDSVLKQLITSQDPVLVRTFLNLLHTESLARQSLKMWPATAVQAESLSTYNLFLSYLFTLEQLDLTALNRVPENDLELFRSMTKLRVLKMANASVTGAWLKTFEKSKNSLETLELTGCITLRGNDLACIGANSALRTLRVTATHTLQDQDFAFLQSLTNLDLLDTNSCQRLKGAFLGYLVSSSSHLREIRMAGCKSLTDEGLAHLPPCPELETFVLTASQASVPALRSVLEKAPKLQVLNLADCKNLTSRLFLDLAQHTKLRELDCSGWQFVPDATFANLKNLTGLQTLVLRNFKGFTGQDLKECTFPALHKLVLANCANFHGDVLRDLPRIANGLESLDLSSLKLTGNQLELLATMPSLRELNMTRCWLKDEDFLPLGPLLSRLTKLQLSGNSLTDKTIPLFESMTQLEYLEVGANDQITDNFLQVVGKIRSLKHLDIVGCVGITAQAVESLTLARPDLIIRANQR